MPTSESGPNPKRVAAGRINARKRWANHVPRVVRLDDLSSEQRRLVLALVDAARSSADEVKRAA